MKRLDLVGKKFGRWTVIRFDKVINKKRFYLCKCNCGTKKSVSCGGLRSGDSKSCGCFKKESANQRRKRGRNTIEYRIYHSMKARCLNSKNKDYKEWGGRGIKICKRWLNDFENFYEDMGKKPKGLSLDRLDNNGNYCNTNCVWSSPKKQCRNTRKNINFLYKGKIQCLSAWSEELDIKYSTLRDRIKKLNWSIQKAFETPIKK